MRSVDLDIHIHDGYTNVIAKLAISPNPISENGTSLHLDGRDITLQSISIDGKTIGADDYVITENSITIDDISTDCVVEIASVCHPDTNTALEGLYLSGGMYCTQCEPEGFRRIAFFPDRPDVMTVFTVRLEAALKFPQLLSNGNLVETGTCGEGRHFAIWHDPHPKPSYLFAAVVGDLDCATDHFITSSGRHVDLHIYVEKGNIGLTDHAVDALKRSMRWDEDTYGLEYDLDLFQIVAVSHFNMGAMENKGLNIFNSKFVLADPKTATDTDLHNVESIIAHEYFHNWTGNRVTCRDWFQLTLKEGLTVYRDQCFSADTHDAGIQRANDVSMLRAAQFPEDRSPTAHPIRPESYREINNFYTATIYEKGAEIIRMLAGYLGKDGFRRGMDLYFARHDGSAVTCDDFVAALADANGADLSAFYGWYSQAGTPNLHVQRGVLPDKPQDKPQDDTALILNFTQDIPITAAATTRLPLPIPVRIGLVGTDGGDVPFSLTRGGEVASTQVVLLTEASQSQAIYPAQDGDVVPSLLRGFSAPVILTDDLRQAERLHLMAHDSDMFNRWDAAQTMLGTEILGLAYAGDTSDGDVDAAIAPLAAACASSLANPELLDRFKAGILTLPAISVLEGRMAPADPAALFIARHRIDAALGRALSAQIKDALLPENTAAFMDISGGGTSGGRALINRLLALAVAAGAEAAISCAAANVHSDNMTLSQGAVMALKDSQHAAREVALQAFHDRWQDNALVMEKWFMMEATSCVHGTVARLKTLMQHPAYDANNPNKMRAVLGAFMTGNPVQFYAKDGSGFAFIGECLIDIDGRNPQLAARMALPLTRMAHYSTETAGQMRAVLEKVQSQAQSSDLREVVDKALG